MLMFLGLIFVILHQNQEVLQISFVRLWWRVYFASINVRCMIFIMICIMIFIMNLGLIDLVWLELLETEVEKSIFRDDELIKMSFCFIMRNLYKFGPCEKVSFPLGWDISWWKKLIEVCFTDQKVSIKGNLWLMLVIILYYMFIDITQSPSPLMLSSSSHRNHKLIIMFAYIHDFIPCWIVHQAKVAYFWITFCL